MKSRWIIGFLLSVRWRFPPMLKRIAAYKARKAQSQTSRGKTRAAQQACYSTTSTCGSQDAGTYPDRLEEVLGTMSAELAEIAQAVS